jgi:hypothetical protein
MAFQGVKCSHLELFADARDSTLELAINQGIDELKEQSADTRNEIATLREDGDRDKIIGWLSATDPSSNHHAACKKHQPATGEWLFKRSEFEHWKRTQNSQLWLYGNGEILYHSILFRNFFYDVIVRDSGMGIL